MTGITGPLGSGKSVGCCSKIMKLASEQAPDEENMRRTRWPVIRNTYNDLRLTTIKTWLDCFPERNCGQMRRTTPITHHIQRDPVGDVPGLDLEVVFLALDVEDDIKHLKSFDCTGAWLNECVELPKGVLDMLTGRVGRFPSVKQGVASWAGIICDTNAHDDMNPWHPVMVDGEGELPPEVVEYLLELFPGIDLSWNFYNQPPAIFECEPDGLGGYVLCEAGMAKVEVDPRGVIFSAGRHWSVNMDAENMRNLRPGYYHQQIANKTLAWVNRYLQAKWVYVIEGRPWVPEYSPELMGVNIEVDKRLPVFGGIDAGGGTLSPAVVWGQVGTFGDWRIIAELSLFDIGLEKFSNALKRRHAELFPWFPLDKVKFGLDPAGEQRDPIYEVAVREHFRAQGINCVSAPTNDPDTRREALALPMGRLEHVNGKAVPGFLVNKPLCPMLHAGLAGKWYRRKVRGIGRTERWVERPEKNEYSHACDAASYMTLVNGEHRRLTRGIDLQGSPIRRGFGGGQAQTKFKLPGH